MSNEAQVHSSLLIQNVTNSEVDYYSRPVSFTADVGSGAFGPMPGLVEATVQGADVDLTGLTSPGGLARIMNLDPTNWVEVGVWDPESGRFYPLLELLPGESYVMRLARNIEQEYGTGTGTAGPDTNRLRLKANTAACKCLVEAFDK